LVSEKKKLSFKETEVVTQLHSPFLLLMSGQMIAERGELPSYKQNGRGIIHGHLI